MDTTEVRPKRSDCSLSVLQNSIAFAESSPRVELSQHCSGALDRVASAMVTLLR